MTCGKVDEEPRDEERRDLPMALELISKTNFVILGCYSRISRMSPRYHMHHRDSQCRNLCRRPELFSGTSISWERATHRGFKILLALRRPSSIDHRFLGRDHCILSEPCHPALILYIQRRCAENLQINIRRDPDNRSHSTSRLLSVHQEQQQQPGSAALRIVGFSL